MKGEIRVTEWMFPQNRDCEVAYVYRSPTCFEEGNLPFYEQEVLVPGPELRSMTKEAVEVCKSIRIRQARQKLEEILAKEVV